MAAPGLRPKLTIHSDESFKRELSLREECLTDNPVAVEVVVKSEGSKLSGTVIFYVIVDQGNGPRVQGKVESALIDPRFDGTMLMFSVKAKGPEADKEVKTEMQMKLTNDNEAELENVGDTTAPVLKMKKVQ